MNFYLYDHSSCLIRGPFEKRAGSITLPIRVAFDRSMILLHDVVEILALAQDDGVSELGVEAFDGSSRIRAQWRRRFAPHECYCPTRPAALNAENSSSLCREVDRGRAVRQAAPREASNRGR